MYNFIIRIYKDDDRSPALSDLQNITISGITLVSKPSKIGNICTHNNNQKKFKYTINLSKPFNKISGSHNYPNLSFKGNYIDIEVFNFPRYPAYYQDKYMARNLINGWGCNELNNGFPRQLLYRKIEIINVLHLTKV